MYQKNQSHSANHELVFGRRTVELPSMYFRHVSKRLPQDRDFIITLEAKNYFLEYEHSEMLYKCLAGS